MPCRASGRSTAIQVMTLRPRQRLVYEAASQESRMKACSRLATLSGGVRRKSTARKTDYIWREDCGGQIPNANDKGMRGGCTLIRVTNPMKTPRGSTRKGKDRGGCVKPMGRTVIGVDTLESNETRWEWPMRNEKPLGLRSDRVLHESPYPRGSRARWSHPI